MRCTSRGFGLSTHSLHIAVVLFGLLAVAPMARAVVTIEYLVLGTFLGQNPITGSLSFGGGPNEFSPNTAIVTDPAEFVRTIATQSYSADFDFAVQPTLDNVATTPLSLQITLVNPTSEPFQMQFTSSLFAGKQLTGPTVEIQNPVPSDVVTNVVTIEYLVLGTFLQNTNTITVNFSGLNPTNTYVYTFGISPVSNAAAVPLPPAAWVGLAMGGVVFCRRFVRKSSI